MVWDAELANRLFVRQAVEQSELGSPRQAETPSGAGILPCSPALIVEGLSEQVLNRTVVSGKASRHPMTNHPREAEMADHPQQGVHPAQAVHLQAGMTWPRQQIQHQFCLGAADHLGEGQTTALPALAVRSARPAAFLLRAQS